MNHVLCLFIRHLWYLSNKRALTVYFLAFYSQSLTSYYFLLLRQYDVKLLKFHRMTSRHYVSTMWNPWNFTEWCHDMQCIVRIFGIACLPLEFFFDWINAATWKYYKYIISRSEKKFMFMIEKGIFDTIRARNFRKASHWNLFLSPIQLCFYS